MTTLGILYDVRQCQNKFTIMLIVEKSINSLNIINTTKYLNGNKHAILSAVYYEYISLCSQYDIEDPLSSRMYIRESVWYAFYNRVFWYF